MHIKLVYNQIRSIQSQISAYGYKTTTVLLTIIDISARLPCKKY